ncbi:MAG: tRNA pseudouridine(13) synthase TruD [Methanobacteriaceae archaeon]|nr:tRNA pseudouridine(13) synthase TruD [Methanobacteriaceae archaeon]
MLNAERFITNNKPTNGEIRNFNEDFYVEEVPLELPSGTGQNVWILIEKTGRTTLDVVLDIAKILHINRKRMGFAGMKDKSAVTRQWICISNITLDEIPDLESILRNVKILDIKQNERKLRIGQLKGNKFRIKIDNTNDPNEDKETAEDVLNQLKKTGVPNFYGYQRFGEKRSNTHKVGKCLIENDVKKAVDQYIGNPYPTETEQIIKARSLYDEGKLEESYNAMSGGMRYEKIMLRILIQQQKKHDELEEKDYIKAIEALPKPLKRMFVNAYESYLFNKVINERIVLGIDKYLPGDIIIDKEEHWVHDVDENTINDDINSFKLNPTAPLYGTKVPLAEGMEGEIEAKVLKEENIKKEDFECPKTPKLGSHGIRRSVRFKVTDTNVKQTSNGIIVEFMIPKGCYATAVLREIMKKNI